MDFLAKYQRRLAWRVFVGTTVPLLVSGALWYVCDTLLNFEAPFTMIIAGSAGISASLITTWLLIGSASRPLEKITELIMFYSGKNRSAHLPEFKAPIARELIESLNRQVYALASGPAPDTGGQVAGDTAGSASVQSVLDAIALPIVGIDSNQIITVANKAAANYVDKPLGEMMGKPLYDIFSLSFQNEDSFELWLKKAQESSAVATKVWERVRHGDGGGGRKQFDMAASFSSGNVSGAETMLAIFDRSELYNLDDEEIGYVALAVHELRTPLTIMRGYIEVFEDELGPTLSPEMADFMHKMRAASQQLTAFVSNILNVARVESDQLTLRLRSENWPEILKAAVNDLELRARVYGKHIELQVDDNLPAVAADRISMHEVINNLVDNAIKYSDKSDRIIVTAGLNNDGVVETSVTDFGIGIPTSVMGNLFQKFHRSHKSSLEIGGTGLGLYLSKAIVSGHGGNIWVRSKEGEGSTFSFTLIPYSQMSEEQLAGEDGITRGAHGWIKNHSLYRG